MFFDHQVVAEDVWPRSGIVAGSPHATFELTLYTITAIRLLRERWPEIRTSIHVDDITMQINGPTKDHVVQTAVQAGSWVHKQFADLHLPFAEDKAVLLASSDDLARDIYRRLGPKAGEIRRQAKSLGLDLTLRKVKAKRAQGERLKEFGRRTRRLRAIKRKVAPAQRIFFGGILPAVWYGVE